MGKAQPLILENLDAVKIIFDTFFAPTRIVARKLPQPKGLQVMQNHKHFDVAHLAKDKCPATMIIADPHRNPVKYWITQVIVPKSVSSAAPSATMPTKTHIACWWCRHKFDSNPIGCPIAYKSPDIYDVEGVFCSFPCMRAYAIDNKGVRYIETQTLITRMFKQMFVTSGIGFTIPIAPSWKLLHEYGGHLSIAEFRDTFGRLKYTETPNISRGVQLLTHELIEEQKLRKEIIV